MLLGGVDVNMKIVLACRMRDETCIQTLNMRETRRDGVEPEAVLSGKRGEQEEEFQRVMCGEFSESCPFRNLELDPLSVLAARTYCRRLFSVTLWCKL
eukprot:3065657-Amphidinium_carterae.3